ncbi:MAG TPA: PAS domain S-box protein, partial [Candidatus Acidoferrum sp.]|nr:PAS domain S-box protein [Candidatus Acidoferrum sp.]
IVAYKLVVSFLLKPDSLLVAAGGIPYFLLLFLATGFALYNAIQNTLKGRPFWLLLAIGYGFWTFNQWIFLYYQFGPHIEVPDNSIADPLLFLHVTFLLAAAATLPHRNVSGNASGAILNSVLTVIFWGFLYFYIVFPYQLFPNATGYALRFDILYLIENWALVLSAGFLSLRALPAWRSIYLHLLGASTLYSLSSAVANLAIDSGGYVNGKLYGLGLTVAVCWFLWIPLGARRLEGSEVKAPRNFGSPSSKASLWAMVAVALISIAVVWELARIGGATGVPTFRLLVAVSAIVCLAMAAFLKEHLAKKELASDYGSTSDRLHRAMESGRAVGCEWDFTSGRVCWFGDLKTSFGVTADTLEESVEDFHCKVHPSDREQASKAMEEAMRDRKLYEAEYRILRPDGMVRWIAARGEFQYSSKGQPHRMSGTVIDITDQKQLKADLLQSQERMCAIVESSDDGIISLDLDGKILTWNAGAHRLFGYSEQESIGQSIMRLIPPQLWAEEREILGRIKDGQAVKHYETIRITKSGKALSVSLTVSPVRDSAGVIVAASKIVRDFSEQKKADQMLQESEDRFRLIANTAPVLIWMSDSNRECVFCNQGWLQFTGRTLEQELGDGWAESVHPDDRERCLTAYAKAFETRVDCQLEYRLRRFDGEYRWILDFGVPRFESDGTFRGYIGSCLDITERKQSEESLHSLTGRLINAQEEERARIARELHDDFTQRLALLGIGLGQLWKKLPNSDLGERASIREMLETIREISSDMHALSHQLHSSKLEHVGLVPAISGLCKEIGEKHKILLVFEDNTSTLPIPKDVAFCLFRVAQEALANVVKHSKTQSARVELGGSAERITLRILDYGKGFEPELQNPEAGIGLIGMTERLRLVKGKLSVKSGLNRGTEVFAEVPLAIAEAAERSNAQVAGR